MIADDALAAAAIVRNYVGETIFNLLVLVGAIKMSDRLIRELMGLGVTAWRARVSYPLILPFFMFS